MDAVRYQVMPPLSAEEYQELYDSIKAEGIHEPIHVDEDGVVIDGHHRSRIATELGIPCPVITHDDLDEAGKRSLAFTLNLKRRHLNREQRRALIAESLKSDPQLSNREHARRTGASDKTVGTLRGEMEESAEIPHFEKRVDPRTGNVSQPASRTPRPDTSPAPGFSPGDLDEINNTEEEVRPVFQPPQEPEHRPNIAPPLPPEPIDRDLERRANAKSSAPNSGQYVAGETEAGRNAKRFDALILARNILKDARELAGMLADTGGINGMKEHLEDIQAAIEAAAEANNGNGMDDALNNLLG